MFNMLFIKGANMNILRKNNLIKKIAIIILFIMCFNMLIPTSSVQAVAFLDGGGLLQPIMDFLVYLADAVLNVLQHNFISMKDVVISPTGGDTDWWGALGWTGFALLGIVTVVYGVATFATGGGLLFGTVCVIGGFVGTVCCVNEAAECLSGEFDLPFIAYHPLTIFSGDVPALDINFINPKESKMKSQDLSGVASVNTNILRDGNNLEILYNTVSASDEYFITEFDVDSDEELWSIINRYCGNSYEFYKEDDGSWGHNSAQAWGASYEIKNATYNIEKVQGWAHNNNIYIIRYTKEYSTFWQEWSHEGKMYCITTENMLRILNIDDTSQYVVDIEQQIEENTTYYESSAAILQSSIATWYRVLRRIALVGLLSVLLYVGIQMILSAAAADKAKYKKMFIDWLVAVCMLFVLHYLMVFIVTLSSKLSEIFETAGVYNMTVPISKDADIHGNLIKAMNEQQLEEFTNADYGAKIDIQYDSDGNPVPMWSGEFMGYIRLMAGANTVRYQLAYGLMYIVLVIYVCTFTFMYLRRVLYMAFLTMVAPLIALTYPIDKIKDGQAQAFGLWLREYIFNALIQPVHLIIYTMTVSQAINLAKDHPVYALVALGFIMPAEKFVRSMFGFQKASTVDSPGGVFGGAALMAAMSTLSRFGKAKNTKEDKASGKVRTADIEGVKMSDIEGASSVTRFANNAIPKNPVGENNAGNTKAHTKGENNTSSQTSSRGEANNSPRQDTSSEDPKKPTIGQRLGRASVSMSNRAKNRILKAKPLRTVGKYTGMAIGGATLGLAGLAAGISTGDFGNVMKFTGSCLGIGGTLGKSLGQRAYDKGYEIKENVKEGYKGSEEYNNEKLDSEYFGGKGYQEMLDNHSLMSDLGGIERAQALRDEIEIYRSHGITDNKQITSCMKAGLSANEGSVAMQMSNLLKGMGLDHKALKTYEDSCKQTLGDKFDSGRVDHIWDVIKANI